MIALPNQLCSACSSRNLQDALKIQQTRVSEAKMRLLDFLWICNCLHLSCLAQFSIRDEILKEKREWIEPGRDRRFRDEGPVEEVQPSSCELPVEIEELHRNLKLSEKQLSVCEASLVKLQLAADLNENGKLDANLVYLRKLIVAVLNRFEGDPVTREGAPTQLQLSLSEKQRTEMREFVTNLNRNSAAQLVDRMQSIINHAQVTYDRVETHSNFRQLYLDICVILGEIDVFTAIQISIVVCAIVFVYIAATCQSKLVTLSYLMVFGTWISFFWHWQNMLRKSQASRHFLSQKNPCEDSRSFYNPLRFFGENSEECEKYLKKMFTPMFWEFTPIEVLCDMVATYTSNVVSVLIVNIMGAVGDAIREFADKQSWFSVVPAFAVLLMILLIVLFKLSGCGVSLFYGAMRVAPSAGQSRFEEPRAPAIYENSHQSVGSHYCSPREQVCWEGGHRSKVKRRKPKRLTGYDSDSENYLTAGEM